MSDEHGRPEQPPAPGDQPSGPTGQEGAAAPYGHVPAYPPAATAPYGVPPAGAPPHGQVPYGQTPYHHNPYGSPAYGMPGYGAPLRDPDARPGTVLAAGIITFVMAGLSGLLFLVFTLVMLVARDSFIDGFRDGAGLDPSSADDADAMFAILLVIGVVLILWCVAAIVLAALALKRRNGARIGLVVSSALTILVSLLAITGGVSVVTLIAGIAVIVLLFTGGANEWYRRRSGEPEIVGMQRF
jgi:hypothetical protein